MNTPLNLPLLGETFVFVFYNRTQVFTLKTTLVFIFDRLQNVVQSVCFNFIHCCKVLTQFSGWKALTLKPFQVVNRQVRDIAPLVLAKRHFELNHMNQKITVIPNVC